MRIFLVGVGVAWSWSWSLRVDDVVVLCWCITWLTANSTIFVFHSIAAEIVDKWTMHSPAQDALLCLASVTPPGGRGGFPDHETPQYYVKEGETYLGLTRWLSVEIRVHVLKGLGGLSHGQ